MHKLKIAIPAAVEDTPNYIRALNALGAEPCNIDSPRSEGYDGLLLPGGDDVAPHFYNRENMGSVGIDEQLDLLQFNSIERFLREGKPIFGICRGAQVINVFFGGTLIQHIANAERHMHTPQGDNVHLSTALEGSFVYNLYGEKFAVNSSHHQAAEKLAPRFKAVQFSDDGIVEALEDPKIKIYGVQWHPERICLDRARPDTVDGRKVIEFFLNLCR